MINEDKIKKIIELFQNRPDFRELFEILTSWQQNQRSIDIDEFVRRFNKENPGSELERRKLAIEFFKKLKECGVGDFLVGRRGKSTRFVWHVAMLDVARSVLEKGGSQNDIVQQVENPKSIDSLPAVEEPPIQKTMAHKYNLRENYEVTLNLPVNLTETEAERLSNFIRTLPL